MKTNTITIYVRTTHSNAMLSYHFDSLNLHIYRMTNYKHSNSYEWCFIIYVQLITCNHAISQIRRNHRSVKMCIFQYFIKAILKVTFSFRVQLSIAITSNYKHVYCMSPSLRALSCILKWKCSY